VFAIHWPMMRDSLSLTSPFTIAIRLPVDPLVGHLPFAMALPTGL